MKALARLVVLALVLESCKPPREHAASSSAASHRATSTNQSADITSDETSQLEKRQLKLVASDQFTAPDVVLERSLLASVQGVTIEVDQTDDEATYFEFALCNKDDPTLCSPSKDGPGSFSIGPHFYPTPPSGDVVAYARSCVRPYHAQDAATNCGKWGASLPLRIDNRQISSAVMNKLRNGYRKDLQVRQLCGEVNTLARQFVTQNRGELSDEHGFLRLMENIVATGEDECSEVFLQGLYPIADEMLAIQFDSSSESLGLTNEVVDTHKDMYGSTGFIATFAVIAGGGFIIGLSLLLSETFTQTDAVQKANPGYLGYREHKELFSKPWFGKKPGTVDQAIIEKHNKALEYRRQKISDLQIQYRHLSTPGSDEKLASRIEKKISRKIARYNSILIAASDVDSNAASRRLDWQSKKVVIYGESVDADLTGTKKAAPKMTNKWRGPLGAGLVAGAGGAAILSTIGILIKEDKIGLASSQAEQDAKRIAERFEQIYDEILDLLAEGSGMMLSAMDDL